MATMKVAVVGAGGFVGAAVGHALQRRGVEVTAVRAPRLPPIKPPNARYAVDNVGPLLKELAASFEGHSAIVNAAGDARAGSSDIDALTAANGVLPAVLSLGGQQAGVERFVHVSSVAVQGRKQTLDETMHTEAFSAYSSSKALGEDLLRRASQGEVVIYRPPGVHGAQRDTTRSLVRIAGSLFSSSASPGTAPTPQAHIDNVGDAVAYLATVQEQPPAIVIHPWEGLTTASLLRTLGGREPLLVPAVVAAVLTSGLRRVSTVLPILAASARRLEVMWLGQGQVRSWMEDQPWSPPAGLAEWRQLAGEVRLEQQREATKGIE